MTEEGLLLLPPASGPATMRCRLEHGKIKFPEPTSMDLVRTLGVVGVSGVVAMGGALSISDSLKSNVPSVTELLLVCTPSTSLTEPPTSPDSRPSLLCCCLIDDVDDAFLSIPHFLSTGSMYLRRCSPGRGKGGGGGGAGWVDKEVVVSQ